MLCWGRKPRKPGVKFAHVAGSLMLQERRELALLPQLFWDKLLHHIFALLMVVTSSPSWHSRSRRMQGGQRPQRRKRRRLSWTSRKRALARSGSHGEQEQGCNQASLPGLSFHV